MNFFVDTWNILIILDHSDILSRCRAGARYCRPEVAGRVGIGTKNGCCTTGDECLHLPTHPFTSLLLLCLLVALRLLQHCLWRLPSLPSPRDSFSLSLSSLAGREGPDCPPSQWPGGSARLPAPATVTSPSSPWAPPPPARPPFPAHHYSPQPSSLSPLATSSAAVA